MRHLLRWPIRFFRWLFEPRAFWVGVWGIIGACAVGYLVADTVETARQLAGLFLEVGGVGVVGIELFRRLEGFGSPRLAERLRVWLARFPMLTPRPRSVSVGVDAVLELSESASAEVWTPMGPTLPAWKRLDALERNVERLRERARKTTRELKEERKERKDAEQKETSERGRGIRDLQDQLERTSVGNVGLELVGLAWVLLGVILTGWPTS